MSTSSVNARCPKITSPLRSALLIDPRPVATRNTASASTARPSAANSSSSRFSVAATMLFIRTVRPSRVNVPTVSGTSHRCSSLYDAPASSGMRMARRPNPTGQDCPYCDFSRHISFLARKSCCSSAGPPMATFMSPLPINGPSTEWLAGVRPGRAVQTALYWPTRRTAASASGAALQVRVATLMSSPNPIESLVV